MKGMNRRTFLKFLGAGAAAPIISKIDLAEAFLIPKELDIDAVLKSFYETSVVCGISYTDFEGTIETLGDSVIFRTIPEITIMDYKIGQKINYVAPKAGKTNLNIDQSKSFSLQGGIKDKQITSEYVGMELARFVDENVFTKILQYVPTSNKGNSAGKYSRSLHIGTSRRPVFIDKNSVLDAVIDMGSVMDEGNTPRDGQRWAVLPSHVLKYIHKRDLKSPSDNPMSKNGIIGIIDDITLYNSNVIPVIHRGKRPVSCMLFGHKDALAFACNIKKRRLLYGEKALKKDSLGVYCART